MKLTGFVLSLMLLGFINYQFTKCTPNVKKETDSLTSNVVMAEIRDSYQFNCSRGQKTFADDKTIKCKGVKRFLTKMHG